MTADTYHHSKKNLVWIIGLLIALLGVFGFAVLFGEGFDPASSDPFWAIVVSLSLFVCIAAFGWMLWRNPQVIVVSEVGIDIPLAFKRPLR